MGVKIVALAVCVLALLHSGNMANTVNKEFIDEVTTCCQQGIMESQKQRNPNCDLISTKSSNVLKIPGLICRTAIKVCCMKQIQERTCRDGMELAKKGSRCGVKSYFGSEDHQECCNCCYLGMEAKRRKMGCQQSLLGYPCQRAFFQCCLSNDQPSRGSPVVSTSQPTTPRQTCSSLRCAQTCSIFNGGPICVCQQGFYLGSDKRSCFDVNECNDQDTCRPRTKCVNSLGSYRCIESVKCPQGFRADLTGRQCEDIDECLVQGTCRDDQDCENLMGAHQCKDKCPQNYVFRNGRCEQPCRNGYNWNGRRCEDIDECLQNPCRSNEECVNSDSSYNCVPKLTCSRGYQVVDGVCEDIDECLQRPCRPNEECKNSDSSYDCVPKLTCPRGYQAANGACEDIDECRGNPCSSNEECKNTGGSYICSTKIRCERGYQAVHGRCEDINECNRSRVCSADKECKNVPGTYQCIVKCSNGYERVGSDCQDINECKGNPCNVDEVCKNRLGTYECSPRPRCESGYEVVDGVCKDIDECQQNRCSADEKCENIPGSYRCKKKLKCSSGKQLVNGRCVDIDECSRGTHTCKPGAERCSNYVGGFTCRCNNGFRRSSGSQHCEDVNECAGYNSCSQTCVNTVGSYKCECRKGYTLFGKSHCTDVDECSKYGDRLCQHQCVNTQGSYKCRCKPGFTLNSDKRSCVDIDECSKTGGRTLCSWRCLNTPGSYRCECPRGFNIYYGRLCVNINECEENSGICTRDKCIDTKGQYKCMRTRCPNQYFVKRSITHCARKFCDRDDTACMQEKRKSIRWYGQGFPNNAAVDALRFTYSISVRGYPKRPEIKYTIKTGNSAGIFSVIKTSYGSCLLKNIRVLKGPREYVLQLVGDVISKGIVESSFVTYLHIYVSRYDFF